MKRKITARELADWMAYERIYGPLGERRGDWHAAQIEAAVFNSQRIRGEPLRVADCILFGPPIERAPDDLEDLKRAARMAAPSRKQKVKSKPKKR